MNEPTIDEQIAKQEYRVIAAKARGSQREEAVETAILSSIERLKSLDAQPVPVEPPEIAAAKIDYPRMSGPWTKYIDTLQSALKLAQEERDRHMGAVNAYIEDAETMNERAEKAEAERDEAIKREKSKHEQYSALLERHTKLAEKLEKSDAVNKRMVELMLDLRPSAPHILSARIDELPKEVGE